MVIIRKNISIELLSLLEESKKKNSVLIVFLNDTFIINCIFKSILGRGKIHRRTQTFASWNTLNLGTGEFIIIFFTFFSLISDLS